MCPCPTPGPGACCRVGQRAEGREHCHRSRVKYCQTPTSTIPRRLSTSVATWGTPGLPLFMFCYYCVFFCLLVCFGFTPKSRGSSCFCTQECSVQGPSGMPGIELGLATYKTNTLLPAVLSSDCPFNSPYNSVSPWVTTLTETAECCPSPRTHPLRLELTREGPEPSEEHRAGLDPRSPPLSKPSVTTQASVPLPA